MKESKLMSDKKQQEKVSDRVSCRGIIGILFGHRYKPRYDVTYLPPNKFDDRKILSVIEGADNGNIKCDMISILAKPPISSQMYRGDICTRCGCLRDMPIDGKSDMTHFSQA